jgi:anti-anti-sigma factor
VSLHGEHDLASSETLRAALAPLLGDLVVDLSDCTFMDSTVIAVLLGKCYDLRDEGRRLELVLPPENAAISRVVDVVGCGD